MDVKTIKLNRDLWEQIAFEDERRTYALVDDHLYFTYGLRCCHEWIYQIIDEDKFTLFKLRWL